MNDTPTPKDIAGSVAPRRQTGYDKWVQSGVVIGSGAKRAEKPQPSAKPPVRSFRPNPHVVYELPPAKFVSGGLPGSNRRSRGGR